MGIVLELYELKNLCKDMAELGAANYAKMVFPAKNGSYIDRIQPFWW